MSRNPGKMPKSAERKANPTIATKCYQGLKNDIVILALYLRGASSLNGKLDTLFVDDIRFYVLP